MKKIFVYIGIFCTVAILFVKCSKQTEDGIMYNYYFNTHWANLEDSIKAENYLKPKKIAKTTVFNDNVQNTDQQAIELFNELLSQISIAELNDLHLEPTSSFTYAVSRWQNPHNPYSGTIIIKSFTYP